METRVFMQMLPGESFKATELFSSLTDDCSDSFLFELSENGVPRYSILGFDPVLKIIFRDGKVFIKERGCNFVRNERIDNPICILKEILDQYKLSSFPKTELPFIGGLFGYLGYGACAYLDNIPQQSTDVSNVSDGQYGLYDSTLILDHASNDLYAVSFRSEAYLQNLCEKISRLSQITEIDISSPYNISIDSIDVDCSFNKQEYAHAFKQTKRYIEQGEVFQIVLSQRFSGKCESNTLDVYRILKSSNPSPYSFYFKTSDFVYLGTSPETFLLSNNNIVMLKAIAGTRRRGKDPEEDARLTEQLQEDEKELAEHYMLVDLARNDLGRVCKPGSIRLDDIAAINKYEHVMHMATTVKGELSSDKSCFDAFQSCFPAGTVSGAPKIRAMELLAKIEPERRGIYAGAIGYFDARGNMDSAIAIRSALIKDGIAHVNAGGGIVFDSDLDAEYEESFNKAKSVLRAIKVAERLKYANSDN